MDDSIGPDGLVESIAPIPEAPPILRTALCGRSRARHRQRRLVASHGAAAEVGATAEEQAGFSAMASYQAPQDQTAWPFGSRACRTGVHADCGHLGSIGHDFRDGGRLMLALCHCGCHSACPLAGRLLPGSRAVWVGLCDCPGTELAEDRLDEAEREMPDLERRWREHQDKRARERQEERAAREATGAAAAGKSRKQIREIYVAELRARGLAVPSDLVLDAMADAIARNREEFSLVYSARLLVEEWRDLRRRHSRFSTREGATRCMVRRPERHYPR